MNRAAVARLPMLGLTAAAAGMASSACLAAEWTIAPSAQLSTQAQDNPRLVPEGGNSEASLGTEVVLQVQRRTERLDLVANTKAGFQRYQQDENLDRNDQQLALTMNWQGEHLTWNGHATGTRDTTLTSELGNTGLTQSNSRHESYELSLGPSWQLSERLSMGSGLAWQVNRYPDPQSVAGGLTNFRYGTASLSGSYVFSDRTSLSLSGSAGRFTSAGSSTHSDNASVSLQAQYALSSLWRVSLGAGPSWVRSLQGKEQGVVYNAGITRQLERSSLSLSASRSQSPSGFGVMTEVDDTSLNYATQFSERLTGSLNFGLVRRRYAIPALAFEFGEVRYRRLDASLAWRMTSSLQLVAGAGNAAQRSGSQSAMAHGYDARLTLSWSGDPHVY